MSTLQFSAASNDVLFDARSFADFEKGLVTDKLGAQVNPPRPLIVASMQSPAAWNSSVFHDDPSRGGASAVGTWTML